MSAEGPLTPEQVTAGIVERAALVKIARRLEANMARRRKVLAQLRGLDDEIRQARRLIRDLTTPTVADVYNPLGVDDFEPEP